MAGSKGVEKNFVCEYSASTPGTNGNVVIVPCWYFGGTKYRATYGVADIGAI